MTQAGFFTARQWRNRPYLISPFFDFLLAGGFALCVLVVLLAFVPPRGAAFYDQKMILGALLTTLAFLVNDPHFIVSYQLFYRDYRAKLQRFRTRTELWLRYILAGIVVPLAMASYFFYAMMAQRMELFGYAVNAMLLTVAWHYAKQAYGVFIMLSSMKKIYYKPWQRKLFVFNSYVLWGFYSVALLSGGAPAMQDMWGVEYSVPQWLDLPPELRGLAGLALTLSGFAALFAAIWGKTNPKPSTTGLVAYFSMYYFLLIAWVHPMWIMLYPLFHSLQYLMFVYAYKRGETATKMQAGEPQAITQLKRFVLVALLCSLLFFDLLPEALSGLFNAGGSLLLPLTASFVVFINIHHYFMDNVIWRKEHTEIPAYLFHRG